ncbi:MAG: glycosyltransferase family protein [Patescibacteria group bacterium]|jgi:uncharacterized protein (TIGR00661 family)
MKYLFFVQGEGRGHLTQALTLKEKLEKRGHTIVAIIVGSKNNKLPSFFQEQINVPLFLMASPNFAVDKQGKGINILSTVLQTIWRSPLYLQSLKKIKKITTDLNPDVLINFYELLGANYYRLYRDKRPLFCLGHQYFIQHPIFKFPRGQWLPRLSFKFYNYLNAPKRATKIALSFTEESDQIKNKLYICPPLIRQLIKDQKSISNNFLLLYMLNAGYSQEIINWGETHPQIKIEAFWNHPENDETNFGPNLTFHHLSGLKFINYLSTCRAYASTAGFDSISEAAYLQKNILMVPTKNHFEQKCNAVDAERAGLAITSENFDLSLIADKSKNGQSSDALNIFKKWVDNYDDKIINLLEK